MAVVNWVGSSKSRGLEAALYQIGFCCLQQRFGKQQNPFDLSLARTSECEKLELWEDFRDDELSWCHSGSVQSLGKGQDYSGLIKNQAGIKNIIEGFITSCCSDRTMWPGQLIKQRVYLGSWFQKIRVLNSGGDSKTTDCRLYTWWLEQEAENSHPELQDKRASRK